MITSQNVDLSNCDREQIQFAGAILPHGALLTVSEPDLRVLQASANCDEMLGVPADRLIGDSLWRIFDKEQLQLARARIGGNKLDGAPYHLMGTTIGGREFEIFGHRRDGVLILEFETSPTDEPRLVLDLYSELLAATTKLHAAGSLQSFLDLTAEQVRGFTGFDRVMTYKFMEDGSGWVRSESLAEGQGFVPYLGLHYPASDIPEPSRRLFSLTWLRHQPDIGYTPVPITPAINPATRGPLDMSYALLRSVSVMYTEYLKNMGTQSSMVMTLMKDEKLWGLIACHHHRGPKHVPYEARMACELLAHTVSLLISAKENLESQAYRAKLHETGIKLVENISCANDFADGLLRQSPTLLDFIRATGAALVLNRRVEILGQTPSREKVLTLADWLSGHMRREIFAADSLSAHLPAAEEYKNSASGVLALRFAKVKSDYILWFRAEQVQAVNWAGDPRKPVDISDDGQRLMPRTSFALWKETVRLKSEPWLDVEIKAASDLRASILELVLRRAEELGRLYENLERRNAELDAFAYVASHDLKEPLRGIENYTEMLRDDYGKQLDEEANTRLDMVSRLARRMNDLLDSLLEYSRLDRIEFAREEVDVNAIVGDAIEVLQPRITAHGVAIRIAGTLPPVRGDSIRLGEVFVNLISNAIKYNDKPEKWIEIGAGPPGSNGQQSFYVRDNGIGIPPEHTEQVFQIFRRLHARGEFGGGAGAGLTITKRIVERHGGTIWVESTLGEGTTFRFTLGGNEPSREFHA